MRVTSQLDQVSKLHHRLIETAIERDKPNYSSQLRDRIIYLLVKSIDFYPFGFAVDVAVCH